jgi:hypothetical protein
MTSGNQCFPFPYHSGSLWAPKSSKDCNTTLPWDATWCVFSFCCHNFGPAQQGLGLWIFRYLKVEEIPYLINLINLISWVFSYSLIPGTQGLKVFKLLVAPTTAPETLSDVFIYGAQGRQIQRSRVHHSPPCSHIMKMYNDVHRCTVISSKAGP